MNISASSSERCLHPEKKKKINKTEQTSVKQNVSSLGPLGIFSCSAESPKLFSAQLRSLSFTLVAQSHLIHPAAHVMSKATDLYTPTTKRLGNRLRLEN